MKNSIVITYCLWIFLLSSCFFQCSPVEETPSSIESPPPQVNKEPAYEYLKGKAGETIIGYGMITCFDATKDGKFLVVGTNLGVMIHDAETFERVGVFRGHENIENVVVSDDGNLVLSASSDGTIFLWGLHSKKIYFSTSNEIVKVTNHYTIPLSIQEIELSPNGNFIAVLSKNYVRETIIKGAVEIWDVRTNKKIYSIPPLRLDISDESEFITNYFSQDAIIQFSPDNSKLLIAGEGSYQKKNKVLYDTIGRILDLRTGEIKNISQKRIRNPKLAASTIPRTYFIAFTQNSTSFFTGIAIPGDTRTIVDNRIQEWDTNTLQLLHQYSLPDRFGKTTAFKLIKDKTAYVNQHTLLPQGEGAQYNYFELHLDTLQFHPILTPRWKSFPKYSSFSSSHTQRHISDITDDKCVYFFDLDNIVKWNTLTNQIDLTIENYQYGIGNHAHWLDHDRKFISIECEITKTYGSSDKILTSSRPSSKVSMWDIHSGRIVKTFSGHDSMITSFDVSYDESKLITSSYDQTAIVWDIPSGQQVTKVNTSKTPRDVLFFPSSKYFVTVNGASPTIWNTSSGEKIAKLDGDNMHEKSVYKIAISPKDDVIVTSGLDATLKIWKIDSPNTDQMNIKHYKTIKKESNKSLYLYNDLDFSPDGHLLAAVSADATTTIYDTKTWNVVTTIIDATKNDPSKRGNNTVSAAFSHNGTLLAISNPFNEIMIVDTSNWMRLKRFNENSKSERNTLGISSIDFSTDDKRILTVKGNLSMENDYVARIWELDETTNTNPLNTVNPN